MTTAGERQINGNRTRCLSDDHQAPVIAPSGPPLPQTGMTTNLTQRVKSHDHVEDATIVALGDGVLMADVERFEFLVTCYWIDLRMGDVAAESL